MCCRSVPVPFSHYENCMCQLEGLLCLPIDLIMCRLGRPEAILFDEEELVVVFFLLQEQAAVKYVHNSGNVVVIGYIGRNL